MALVVPRSDLRDRLFLHSLRLREARTQIRQIGPRQIDAPDFHLAQSFDLFVSRRLDLRRGARRKFSQRLLALTRQAESQLRLPECEQGLLIMRIGLQNLVQFHAGDVVAALVQIVQSPNQALLRCGFGRIEFGIPEQMRDARRRSGVILEVLGYEVVVLAFERSQMLLHREHRFRIVACS